MPTRYYILEGDATTAGGIVQKTANTLSFKVYGKNQSYIGDDVWCPACQSMGKIIPDQDRLSTKVNGRMPALNDDLCLCKCTPPPKLVHSQTSFKEKVSSQGMAISASQLKESPTQTPSTYSASVRFVDDDGYPYANVSYTAKNKKTSKIHSGRTDENGQTPHFFTDSPDEYEIKLDLDWQNKEMNNE